MYSLEIVNKAISATVKGFCIGPENFRKDMEKLPAEIQAIIAESMIKGFATIDSQMKALFSEASNIEKKIKEVENPTKKDIDKIFDEAFRRITKE